MGVGLDDLLEPGSRGRTPLGVDQVLTGEVGDEVSHIIIAQRVEHGRGDGRALGAHSLGVRGLAQPFARAERDPRARQLGAHHVGGEEVRLHELAERAADLVFAVGDDRGVRDREAERTRNSAVTANQSASAPTMPPSAAART